MADTEPARPAAQAMATTASAPPLAMITNNSTGRPHTTTTSTGGGGGRHRRQLQQQPSASTSSTAGTPRSSRGQGRNRNRDWEADGPSVDGGPNAGGGEGRKRRPPPASRQQQGQQAHGQVRQQPPHANSNSRPQQQQQPNSRNGRRAAFGGQLSAPPLSSDPTEPVAACNTSSTIATPGKSTSRSKNKPKKEPIQPRPVQPPPEDADLTTSLTWAVANAPFPDCSICFNSIYPTQAIWSCTPTFASEFGASPEVDGVKDNEVRLAGTGTCCWGLYHLKCINDWASRSVKDVIAREGAPEWRCPGCQTKRRDIPQKYECYCGAQTDPKSSRLTTPHSHSGACSRTRPCGHPCPLDCHPGPCAPCAIALNLPCGSHGTLILTRCSRRVGTAPTSCGQTCGRALACRNSQHVCEEPCHEGPCLPCAKVETLECYCGRKSKVGPCGQGLDDAVGCDNGKDKEWIGRWSCALTCDRPYDCGKHTCQEECHPHPRQPQTCPRSPTIVTTCPCGGSSLSSLPIPARRSCQDPIPTCGQRCGKHLPGCSHQCLSACHLGECPPCGQDVTLPCRCGESKMTQPCYVRKKEEVEGLSEVLCERTCRALRSCKRHECGRVCCPLAFKNKGGGKGKQRRLATDIDGDDDSEWHTCELVCGKQLSCGNHTCPALDHKGPCPPCLEASYEEVVCNCRRTKLDPPIRCGTVLSCSFPCIRPPPACGHPKSSHACHESPICPPCVFLTTKTCACGKRQVTNVRCSQARTSCGETCGKLLGCGWHRCEKPCHSPGECESPCVKPCGKLRKLCAHPCQMPCHSPAVCDESIPCSATTSQSCACGRVQQQTTCGASVANPISRERTELKCIDECERAKRNDRLALALGINPSTRQDRLSVEWPQDIVQLALAGGVVGPQHLALVEKAFATFIGGSRQTQVLPHMPLARRDFTQKMAEVYRLGTDLVDQEPARSVQLRRRIDARIPHPLLSEHLASLATAARNPSSTLKPSLLTTNSSTRSSPSISTSVSSLPSSIVKPKPSPWGGGFASAAASGNSSSAGSSRPSSPYVPPSRRAAAAAVALTIAPTLPSPPSAPNTSADVLRKTTTVEEAAAAYVPPPVDDSWENDDDGGEVDVEQVKA